MKKRPWLEIAEYFSLAGSALGTVAAAISSQVTYAAAPLTLALSLNLVNRHRSQQQTRQYTSAAITDVHQAVKSLHNQVQALPSETVNLDSINQSLSQLEDKTQRLKQQFNIRPEPKQIQELKEALADLPYPLELREVQQAISAQVDESVRSWAMQIDQQLTLIKPHDYELVIDRPGSRAVLMQALRQAQHRLILVCPWIGYGTDYQVIQNLEVLLQRNVRVDIGWGRRKDIDALLVGSGSICQRLKSYSDYYSALPKLAAFEQKYPKQFKLKLLGTHEKFLVCDSEWAMIGSHNFLTSSAFSSERELGLKTNDLRIIADLVERFDGAENLEKL